MCATQYRPVPSSSSLFQHRPVGYKSEHHPRITCAHKSYSYSRQACKSSFTTHMHLCTNGATCLMITTSCARISTMIGTEALADSWRSAVMLARLRCVMFHVLLTWVQCEGCIQCCILTLPCLCDLVVIQRTLLAPLVCQVWARRRWWMT